MSNSAGRLYRTMKFHHAVHLFQTGTLYFPRPTTWEDPYETRLKHEEVKRVYAQCWCASAVSDAMWRIYSPDHLGVRIGTTTKKLEQQLRAGAELKGINCWASGVTYLSPTDLRKKTKELVSGWKNGGASIADCSRILQYKREAYVHENEFRIVLIDNGPDYSEKRRSLSIPVNAFEMIDSILIDPRAPKELADALVHYFKTVVKFPEGRPCKQSVLYKKPRAVQVHALVE